ncbi:unnamed protein product [Soboliphyme baturini]|uniref:BBS2_N domain-containing protein n=1 Tax=Soboliphyme baturini TaxID=241478 RepID=A0A183IST1_9BILA|nr:unnamed protein product [Soboliphyme baturini]
MSALKPAFGAKLNHKILPGTLCIGCFDSDQPCLASADAAGKVSLYPMDGNRLMSGSTSTANSAGENYSDVTVLNVNQHVKAMISCQLKPNSKRDVIILGTGSHFMAYDVNDNCDLFYKQVRNYSSVLNSKVL